METLLLAIYVVGVVLTPVVVGACVRDEFRTFDDGIPLFMISFFWPAVVVLCMGGVVALSLLWIPGWVWKSLMNAGKQLRHMMDEYRENGDAT